jgi:hypothetical protein
VLAVSHSPKVAKTKQINVRLDDEVYEDLQAFAEELQERPGMRVTLSDAARVLIMEGLQRRTKKGRSKRPVKKE